MGNIILIFRIAKIIMFPWIFLLHIFWSFDCFFLIHAFCILHRYVQRFIGALYYKNLLQPSLGTICISMAVFCQWKVMLNFTIFKTSAEIFSYFDIFVKFPNLGWMVIRIWICWFLIYTIQILITCYTGNEIKELVSEKHLPTLLTSKGQGYSNEYLRYVKKLNVTKCPQTLVRDN